ncbi:MAG: ATP-binding protein [Thermodesulfobacteriota bacterium]
MLPPYRKALYAIVLLILAVLGIVISLGSRHYQMHSRYSRIIEHNEKLLFQFVTIREHVTESLLENRFPQLGAITSEVEDFNVNLSRILEDPVIPDELKLTFVNQVDLAGIILLMRGLASGPADPARLRQLNHEIRLLGDRLVLFDRLIVNHVKGRLVAFQTVVIGVLALAVFVIINIVLLGHRRLAVPVFELARQADAIRRQGPAAGPLSQPGGVAGEIAGVLQDLLDDQERVAADQQALARQLVLQDRLLQAVSRAATPQELGLAVVRALTAEGDYQLAWIGLAAGDGSGLRLLAADASGTMTREGCQLSMELLLDLARERGEAFDAAAVAVAGRQPVVRTDILAEVPKGAWKHTPLAAGPVHWLAVPLLAQDRLFGALSLYRIGDPPEAAAVEAAQRSAAIIAGGLMVLQLHAEHTTSQWLRQQMEAAGGTLVVQLNREGGIVAANPALCEAGGWTPADLLGRRWPVMLSGTQAGQIAEAAWQAAIPGRAAAGPPMTCTVRAKDGAERWLAGVFVRLTADPAAMVHGLWLGRDLTPGRQLAQQQRAWLAQAAALLDGLPEPVLVADQEGAVLVANSAAAAAVERPAEDLRAKPWWQALGLAAEETLVAGHLQQARPAQLPLHRPGSDREHLLVLTPLAALGDGQSACVLALKDVTAERRRQLDLQKASQLAAIGEVAVGIAHEISNLSNGLINQAQLVADSLAAHSGAEPDQAELCSGIINQGERIAQVAGQLLAMNGSRVSRLESVRIDRVIEDSLSLVRNQLRSDGIQVRTDFDHELPSVRVNVGHLQHVFLNLLNNARHALNLRYHGQHDNKRLEITGRSLTRDGRRQLRVSFTDWGVGVDPSIIHHIFDPDFSTKPASEGTGLGLAVSQSLVRQHQGDLRIESIPNDHTTVIVDLPSEQAV